MMAGKGRKEGRKEPVVVCSFLGPNSLLLPTSSVALSLAALPGCAVMSCILYPRTYVLCIHTIRL
jgi:hypothetical protein